MSSLNFFYPNLSKYIIRARNEQRCNNNNTKFNENRKNG